MSEAVMRMLEKEKRADSAVRSLNRSVRRQNRSEFLLQMKECIAQRNQFEMTDGQEYSLPHELGDIVQQKLKIIRKNAVHPTDSAPSIEDEIESRSDVNEVEIVQRMSKNVVQRCGGKKDSSEEKKPLEYEENSAATTEAVKAENEEGVRKEDKIRATAIQKRDERCNELMDDYKQAMEDYKADKENYEQDIQAYEAKKFTYKQAMGKFKKGRGVYPMAPKKPKEPLMPSLPAVVVGAYDIETGKVAVRNSGPIENRNHCKLIDRAKTSKIGDIGEYNEESGNVVGTCAEFHAANALLYSGSKIENIRFTSAIRPWTGKVIPACLNCRAMFKNILGK